MNDPVMMISALGLITGSGQRRRRKLEGSVIGDVETPIIDKPGRPTGSYVTICDAEQAGDFLPACLVLVEPPVLEPVL